MGVPTQGRWGRLFADLEGIAGEYDQADLAAEVADRSRGEIGRLRLTDRARAATGHRVVIMLTTNQQLSGIVVDTGPDWLLVREEGARETLVAAQGMAAITGFGALSATPGSEGQVAARLGLRSALRRLVQGREPVVVTLAGGATLSGTCDGVGADYVEIAEHASGEFRRRAAVRAVHTVPLGALVLMRPA